MALHPGVDVALFGSTAGLSVSCAHGPVDLVRHVHAADVAIAGQAEVSHVDRVLLEDANRIGAHQEAVRVEMEAVRVMAVGHAAFNCVAGYQEVLVVIVGEQDVLGRDH